MDPRDIRKDEGGVVLVLAFMIVAVIAGLSMSFLSVTTTESRGAQLQRKDLTAFYAAEAGINRAFVDLQNNGTGNIGSAGSPISFSGATYYVTTTANGTYYTVTAHATYSKKNNAVEAVFQKQGGGVYYNALFAGNSGGSTTYNMKFGGQGNQADNITGDVYSGKNILSTDNAKLTGAASAAGTITGWTGSTGVSEPIPDLASKNYATTADINVNSHFASATSGSWTYGGTAQQVASTDPCRIFRLNPSDRTSQYSGLDKTQNFYLEDKYATWVDDGGNSDSAHAHTATINDNANNKVFYIDGNLWMNNLNAMSFKFVPATAGASVKMTIVVKGNIYIGDNLYYNNATTDGLALIALKDGAVADSGNIYFGDPNFGTLEHMQAFMYAENNFYDNNLDAAGSAVVTVDGNMTAGNQVAINRDYSTTTTSHGHTTTTTNHSKLTVNFDARIKNGTLTLPNIPAPGVGATNWAIMSWRRLS